MYTNWNQWADVIGVFIYSGAIWMAFRHLARPRRAHIGSEEHSIGSVFACPGCDDWRERHATSSRMRR